jgi:ABC-2 type transport system ATP-binding protein
MKDEKQTAIAVTGLAKRFDDVVAVSRVDFEVQSGELFGFLGPNGAGKTTTINMLTGLARPDAGSIRIGGIDCSGNPRAAQHLVGVVPDESNLYPELTGFGNLCFCASLYGLAKTEREERARRLLDEFGLTRAADRKFAGYSKGMKRKLTIAAGIIHRPDILFLDEPTTGIDVASARQLRKRVSELNRKGTTIFLTTHYIEEAERLCDRIAFIVDGRVVRIAAVADLLEPLQNRQTLQLACTKPLAEIPSGIADRFPDYTFSMTKTGCIRVVSDGPIGVGPLVRFLEDRGSEITEARRQRASLEDVFMRVTGLEADVMRKEKEKGGKRK